MSNLRTVAWLEFDTFDDFPLEGKDFTVYVAKDTELRYKYLNDLWIPSYEEFNDSLTLTLDNTWHVITLPVDLRNRAISIHIYNSQGNDKLNGFRHVGSSRNRYFNVPSNDSFILDVKVDGNNQVEAYSSKRSQMEYTIISAHL